MNEKIEHCDACGEVSPGAWSAFRDGLCRGCQAAGIERCEWCCAPAPGPRRGYPDPPADPRPVCRKGHHHTVCGGEDCAVDMCPDEAEAQVAKAVMA